MPPLVSIIVPVYNAAPWLAATLESALSQSHRPTEIIVVDDGSTDSSLALASTFESRGVRVATQPNRGAAAARNHGLRLARGEFLQFLDADDLLAPDKIAHQVARLATAPGSIASCAWGRFHGDPGQARFVSTPAWRDFPQPADFFIQHFNDGWMMFPAAWLVPRAVAAAAGPWDERLSLNDDGEYFCRVALASRGIVFCGDARAYYRSGVPGSLSDRKDPAAYRSLYLSIDLSTRALLAHADTPAAREAAANAWFKVGAEVYPDLQRESREALAKSRAFGGPTRPLEMGRRMRLVSRLIGWRLAKRVQRALQPRRARAR